MTWYVWVSLSEGVLICCLLSWEIFWLRKLYKVLMGMWAIIDANAKAIDKVADALVPKSRTKTPALTVDTVIVKEEVELDAKV